MLAASGRGPVGRHREHPVFPHVLSDVTIDRPDQGCAMDATYIPIRRGFVRLTAVLDWARRRVPAWRSPILLAADAAVEAVEEPIAKHSVPETMNTDQGSQFASAAFINVLRRHRVRISIDSKGC